MVVEGKSRLHFQSIKAWMGLKWNQKLGGYVRSRLINYPRVQAQKMVCKTYSS